MVVMLLLLIMVEKIQGQQMFLNEWRERGKEEEKRKRQIEGYEVSRLSRL